MFSVLINTIKEQLKAQYLLVLLLMPKFLNVLFEPCICLRGYKSLYW